VEKYFRDKQREEIESGIIENDWPDEEGERCLST
jgi:hypothetical protein